MATARLLVATSITISDREWLAAYGIRVHLLRIIANLLVDKVAKSDLLAGQTVFWCRRAPNLAATECWLLIFSEGHISRARKQAFRDPMGLPDLHSSAGILKTPPRRRQPGKVVPRTPPPS